jgi:hypothetical protein
MSHSEIPADKVLKACLAYLENRDRHIREVKEELIAHEMQPRKFLWWTSKGKTREQAIKSLESEHWSEYGMIEIEGGHWAYKVKKLMALCKVPGATTVKLSSEDAHTLSRFFG